MRWYAALCDVHIVYLYLFILQTGNNNALDNTNQAMMASRDPVIPTRPTITEQESETK